MARSFPGSRLRGVATALLACGLALSAATVPAAYAEEKKPGATAPRRGEAAAAPPAKPGKRAAGGKK